MTHDLRWAGPGDYGALAELMFDAVRNGDSPYDDRQRRAWVPAPRSGPEWEQRLAGEDIVVAETGGEAVGFMSLAADGYIDFAYIRPRAQGSGLFRRMFERIEDRARARGEPLLWVHASLKAQPAFAAVGFTVRHSETVQIVIGRRCSAATESDAMAHVFGYTCGNDVTASEILSRDASFTQWTRAKGLDGFCPLGPVVATGLDASTLRVRTLLDGQVRQDYPISDMSFSVAQLVSRISLDMTLLPGDVILCGTSVGVGSMKPGSLVEVEIDGIGRLANRNA